MCYGLVILCLRLELEMLCLFESFFDLFINVFSMNFEFVFLANFFLEFPLKIVIVHLTLLGPFGSKRR